MDSRYTNREKYLDGLSNRYIAELVTGAYNFCYDGKEFFCRKYCPLYTKPKCKFYGAADCVEEVEKWLGEYSDD